MNPFYLRWRLIFVAVVCLTCGLFAVAADEPTLTKEQIKQFLLTAKVVRSQAAKKGITQTHRLTLSDGTVTHDASFQTIDEHKSEKALAKGIELHFVDLQVQCRCLRAGRVAWIGRYAAGIRRTQIGGEYGLAQLVVAGEDG
jgi:hypothetical protein